MRPTSFSRRTPQRLAALLVAAALVAGCGGDDAGTTDDDPTTTSRSSDPSNTSGSGPSTSTTSDAPTTSVSPPPGSETVQVRIETIAQLDPLTAMATHPDSGDLYVAEHIGRIRRIDPVDGGEGTVVADLSSRIACCGERGLLGIAIHPDGDTLYVNYTDLEGHTHVDELTIGSDGSVERDSRRQVLRQEQPFPNHNGGQLAFDPDGNLLIAFGDGGSGGDPLGSGQDLGTWLGKILRVDPRGGEPYAVPADNPFADGGGKPEIWLYGVRNPWRFSFDRGSGDLWIADVGQDLWEEIDVLPAPERGRGTNLGWNRLEATHPYDGAVPADHIQPIHEYSHEEGCAVTGGFVYRGRAIPALVGTYVFGDYCTGELWGIDAGAARAAVGDGGLVPHRSLGATASSLASFGEGLDGELYVLTGDGVLGRIVEA